MNPTLTDQMRTAAVFLLTYAAAFADVWVAPGDTDDLIRQAAKPGETVHIGAGTFEVEGFVIPGDRTRIIGSGIGRTVLHRKGAAMYAVIQNEMTGSNGIEVSGLTIDCAETSAFGLMLFGNGNTARDIHVRNHVSPIRPDGQRQESFAILLTNGSDPSTGDRIGSDGNLIENCRVTDFKGNYDGGIVVAGWPSPHWALGTVRGCTFIGNGKPDAGLDFSGIISAQVTENNTVINAAIGTYIEGGGWGHNIIRGNRYLGCRTGIRIAMSYGYTLENLVIADNYFEIPDGGAGVLVTSDNAMRRVSITGNRFVKTGASGAWCNLTRVPFLTLTGNVWDVPLTGAVTGTVGTIGENLSSDGQFRTRSAWLKKAKPGNQLKVAESP
jgi:hypothetical protein